MPEKKLTCLTLKQKLQIIKEFEENPKTKCHLRCGMTKRQLNSIVSSLILINKAKEFAVDFGEDFKPDSNWLFRWKKRQNITAGTSEGDIFELCPISAEYIKCDDDLKCCGEINEFETDDTTSEEETEEDDEDFKKIPTIKEALAALKVLQKYCFHNNIDTTPLDQLKDQILKLSMKAIK